MESQFIDCAPNAYKTLNSMRHLGYKNIDAIADIVDNSIDANADTILVEISDKEIIVSDNGCGMDLDTLKQCLRLGSDTKKEEDQSNLGKYGMGLTTASLSIGTKVSVLSRAYEDAANMVTLDLDKIKKSGRWELELAENIQDKRLHLAPASQTVVAISDIDKLDYGPDTVVKNVIEHLGLVFNKILEAGDIHMYVNGKEVKPIDELMEKDGADIIYDETIKLDDDLSVDVKVAVIPDKNTGIIKNNIPNQGFYMIRNGRIIEKGNTLGLWAKHNSHNRIRGEISFSGNDDEKLGITFMKNGIVFKQGYGDKMKAALNPIINSALKRIKKVESNQYQESIDHGTAIDAIEKKKTFLALSDRLGWRERRDKNNNPNSKKREKIKRETEEETQKRHKNRVNIKKFNIGERIPSVEIRNKQMGEHSELYTFYPENRKFIIEWNVDHPFFKEMLGAQEDSRVKDCMDFLIYAMAQSEFKIVPAEEGEESEIIQLAMDNFRTELGTMLRVLMQ